MASKNSNIDNDIDMYSSITSTYPSMGSSESRAKKRRK